MEGTLTSARLSLAQGCIQLCPGSGSYFRSWERELVISSRHSPRGGQMPLDRAAGLSLLPCSVGKETFLTYLWQPQRFGFFFFLNFILFYFSGSRAKHSYPLGADPRGDSVNLCSLVDQSPKVSWVRLARGAVGLESPAYFIASSITQRACVCSSLLTRPSDSDKGTQ